MHRIKVTIVMLMAALAMHSCIEPYSPLIKGDDSGKYVVFGLVTDNEGYQEVSVSRSSPVSSPRFIPVTGCTVMIVDDRGNDFPAEESGDGTYRAWMEQEDLVPGVSYKVEITTPDGDLLTSEYDRMPQCPPIDTVYSQAEEVATSDPANPLKGLQVYVDVDATGLDSRYFRWEVEETWEYHMDWARQFYYDGTIHRLDPPDISTKVCWITHSLVDIFDVSTQGLGDNIYRKYPLHFIDNKSPKLTVLYSMLIRQYSLSEEAYQFWDHLRINSSGQGGLYEHQPLAIRGNLRDELSPEREVLGFFGASSVQQQRYFISIVEGLDIEFGGFCFGPVPLGIFGWIDFTPDEFPVYFIYLDGWINTLSDDCIDCLVHGGVNVKPSFWPE